MQSSLLTGVTGTVQQPLTRREKGGFTACEQGRSGEVLRTPTGLEGKREGLGERERKGREVRRERGKGFGSQELACCLMGWLVRAGSWSGRSSDEVAVGQCRWLWVRDPSRGAPPTPDLT